MFMQKLISDPDGTKILCTLNHEIYTFNGKLGLTDIQTALIWRGDLQDPIIDLK